MILGRGSARIQSPGKRSRRSPRARHARAPAAPSPRYPQNSQNKFLFPPHPVRAPHHQSETPRVVVNAPSQPTQLPIHRSTPQHGSITTPPRVEKGSFGGRFGVALGSVCQPPIPLKTNRKTCISKPLPIRPPPRKRPQYIFPSPPPSNHKTNPPRPQPSQKRKSTKRTHRAPSKWMDFPPNSGRFIPRP